MALDDIRKGGKARKPADKPKKARKASGKPAPANRLECPTCGELFAPKRKNATHCSPACRTDAPAAGKVRFSAIIQADTAERLRRLARATGQPLGELTDACLRAGLDKAEAKIGRLPQVVELDLDALGG